MLKIITMLSALAAAHTAASGEDPGRIDAAVWSGAKLRYAQDETQKMAFEHLEKRGADLRTSLKKKYAELVSSGKLSGGRNNITNSVLPFIPIGISFDEAETILRAAGFNVEPYPDLNAPPNPNRTRDWYGVVATIPAFVERFGMKVSVYIMLLPKSPGDYTTVSDVKASFLVLTL